MSAASLMSHCLASTGVPAAGSDLFTEGKRPLSAGTDRGAQIAPAERAGLIWGHLPSWKVLKCDRQRLPSVM